MEWYWIVLLVVGFFGIAGLFVYLGMNGKLSQKTMSFISGMMSALTQIMEQIDGFTENELVRNLNIAMTMIDKAVKAAENAWYNDEIQAEEREAYCMEQFNALMLAAGVTLTDAQLDVIKTLIAASCEELGHNKKTKAEG